MKGRKPGGGGGAAICAVRVHIRTGLGAKISSKARKLMAGKTNNESTQKTNYDTT